MASRKLERPTTLMTAALRRAIAKSLTVLMIASSSWRLLDAQPTVIPAASPPEEITDKEHHLSANRLRGDFRRSDYGYAVRVPGEVLAYGPWQDSTGISGSSHGFHGSLLTDRTAEISVFAIYDVFSSLPNAAALEAYILKLVVPEDARPAIVRRTDVKLGVLVGRRIVGSFRRQTVECFFDVAYAFRVVSGHETVLYDLCLTAAYDRYLKDRPILDVLINSFRTLRVTG